GGRSATATGRSAPTRRVSRRCWAPGRPRPAPWRRRPCGTCAGRWAWGRQTAATAGGLASLEPVPASQLELDLDVFAGPFDLLLTLVLREEIDLLEVDLADVVLTYLDHLQERGELDLEVATEFLVLISGLLELKSRLMLPRPRGDELPEVEPAQAAEELLARMLAHRRYRRAAGELA